jgi:hypothetical protein
MYENVKCQNDPRTLVTLFCRTPWRAHPASWGWRGTSRTSPRSTQPSTLAYPEYQRLYSKVFYYTDKKENEIFLIYKKTQMRAVAKSYMRKGFLIYEEMRNI